MGFPEDRIWPRPDRPGAGRGDISRIPERDGTALRGRSADTGGCRIGRRRCRRVPV